MKCPYCGKEFSDTVAENHINNKWCLLNEEEKTEETEIGTETPGTEITEENPEGETTEGNTQGEENPEGDKTEEETHEAETTSVPKNKGKKNKSQK